MQPEMVEASRMERIGQLFTEHGKELVQGMIILVVGILVAKYLTRLLEKGLKKLKVKEKIASNISRVTFVLMLIAIVAVTLEWAGIHSIIMIRILIFIFLGVIAFNLLLKQYVPSLPFKVGNTVMIEDLLGRIEAINLMHTRMKTFDGKTLFIPNKKILGDNVVNYHYTPTRQIRLVVGIHYQADLMKAKQIILEMLAEDPRILDTPAPRVFVLNLAESCIEIAVRPWVNNMDYWIARCDLLEKIKLRFDYEGITIAFPQRDVHLYYDSLDRKEQWLSEAAVLEQPTTDSDSEGK